jgi:FkbM family methyltransferase
MMVVRNAGSWLRALSLLALALVVYLLVALTQSSLAPLTVNSQGTTNGAAEVARATSTKAPVVSLVAASHPVVAQFADALVKAGAPLPFTFAGVTWQVPAQSWPFYIVGPHVEKQIGDVLLRALREAPAPAIAWDIGMNGGVFTALIALSGYEVYAFEPQPYCHGLLAAALALNGGGAPSSWTRRAHPFLAGVSDRPGHLAVSASSLGCNTGFQVPAKQETHSWAQALQVHSGTVSVPLVRLSELRPGLRRRAGGTSDADDAAAAAGMVGSAEVVAAVKIDTEGAEPGVLSDLLPLLEAGLVRQLVVEVVPSMWQDRGADIQASVAIMERVVRAAKRTVLLEDVDMVTGVRPATTAEAAEISGPGEAVPGPFWFLTDVRSFLLDDRLPKRRGCNMWFVF